jgi:hypothetical protein
LSTDELAVEEALELRRIQAGLDEAVSESGVASLSDTKRSVYLVLWAKAVIDNGGFTYYASGPHTISDAARAFEALGLDALAEACRQVVQLFPDQAEPEAREHRVRAVRRFADEGLLASIEDRFWEIPMQLVERAALEYIRSHGEEFGVTAS